LVELVIVDDVDAVGVKFIFEFWVLHGSVEQEELVFDLTFIVSKVLLSERVQEFRKVAVHVKLLGFIVDGIVSSNNSFSAFAHQLQNITKVNICHNLSIWIERAVFGGLFLSIQNILIVDLLQQLVKVTHVAVHLSSCELTGQKHTCSEEAFTFQPKHFFLLTF